MDENFLGGEWRPYRFLTPIALSRLNIASGKQVQTHHHKVVRDIDSTLHVAAKYSLRQPVDIPFKSDGRLLLEINIEFTHSVSQ